MKIVSVLPFLCGLIVILLAGFELTTHLAGKAAELREIVSNSTDFDEMESAGMTNGTDAANALLPLIITMTAFAVFIAVLVIYQSCKDKNYQRKYHSTAPAIQGISEQRQKENEERQKLILLMTANDPFFCFMV